MITLLLDENLSGDANLLRVLFRDDRWKEFAASLDVRVVTFDELGISQSIEDDDVWRTCQDNRWFLITDNRNADGPRSLEETIRRESMATSLPVFTVGSRARFRSDRAYAHRVVERLLEYLLDDSSLGGAGRLFLP